MPSSSIVPETMESLGGFYQNFKNRLVSGAIDAFNFVMDSATSCYSPRQEVNDEVDSQFLPNGDDSSQQNGVIDTPRTVTNSKIQLVPYTEPTQYTISDSFRVEPAISYGSHPKLPVYSMQSARRGVLFLVNIINFVGDAMKRRDGAHHDQHNLITLFREFGYEIFYYEDLTRQQFADLVKELIDSNHLTDIDSFVMCILSHGDMKAVNGKSGSDASQTVIEFADHKTTGTEGIVRKFSNRNCKSLATKPKVFLFPCCRGTFMDTLMRIEVNLPSPARQEGRIQTDGNRAHGELIEVPSYSDIIICYATLPGFVAHRDTESGSWYITELCKVFAQHAHDTHLENLLKMLNKEISNIRVIMQQAQTTSTDNRGFEKLMFFNPQI